MNAPTIRSFEAWDNAMSASQPYFEERIACPECDGSGETECCECGHERDCEVCEGAGSFDGEIYDELPDELRRKLYGEDVAKQVVRYAGAVGEDPISMLEEVAQSPVIADRHARLPILEMINRLRRARAKKEEVVA